MIGRAERQTAERIEVAARVNRAVHSPGLFGGHAGPQSLRSSHRDANAMVINLSSPERSHGVTPLGALHLGLAARDLLSLE